MLRLAFPIAVFTGSLIAAGPTFTGVVNPASNIPPGLPNYGIAQGSIFVVYGANLGPASLAQASFLPLPTTAGLAGTSITVTVNGTTLPAPMIYTFQSQVAAILPSSTPVGTGTLNLTYNGASGSTPITVVSTNFGISTVNESGSGPAVVTYPDYSLVDKTSSTKAGDTLIIWGTGLGPTASSDANVPAQADLGTPVQVFVGGVQANVLYRGRSADPGLDQINVVVPQGVPPGCNVSLVVQTANLVSNSTSVSVAPNGGTCSDPPATQPPTLPPGKTSYKFGIFSISSVTEYLTNTTSTMLSASANFEAITTGAQTGVSTIPGLTVSTVSAGSCSVTAVTESLPATGGGPGTSGTTVTGLNAGGSISLTPPSGSVLTLEAQSVLPGFYTAAPASLAAGTYQFSNGTGGTDIGPFTVNLGVPSPLIWTNTNAAKSVIDRTQPLTLTWTGGDPNGYVLIDLLSLVSSTSLATETIVLCTAPVSAGQFTVPPNVLLLIPTPVPAGNLIISNSVSLVENGLQILNVPGLDLAEGFWEYLTGIQTTFK